MRAIDRDQFFAPFLSFIDSYPTINRSINLHFFIFYRLIDCWVEINIFPLFATFLIELIEFIAILIEFFAFDRAERFDFPDGFLINFILSVDSDGLLHD